MQRCTEYYMYSDVLLLKRMFLTFHRSNHAFYNIKFNLKNQMCNFFLWESAETLYSSFV